MNILIVEDDYIAAQTLSNVIIDLGYNALGPVAYYSEAIQLINETKPDIAILDIELRGLKSGLDLAKTINSDYNFPFIFLTLSTDKDLYRRIIYTQPFAILTKPFNIDELYATLELTHFNNTKKKNITTSDLISNPTSNQFIYIKKGQSYIRLNLEEIVYVKSDNVYIDIVTTTNQTYVTRTSLDQFISQLNTSFIRIHRSYIVNVKLITKIESDYALVNTKNIPIGKKFKPELLNKLRIL